MKGHYKLTSIRIILSILQKSKMFAKPEDILTNLDKAAGVLVVVIKVGADVVEDTDKEVVVCLYKPRIIAKPPP